MCQHDPIMHYLMMEFGMFPTLCFCSLRSIIEFCTQQKVPADNSKLLLKLLLTKGDKLKTGRRHRRRRVLLYFDVGVVKIFIFNQSLGLLRLFVADY